MRHQLILVGASARAAAFSALRAGLEPYAIDCFADRDLAAVCPAVRIDRYPHDFEPALARAPHAPWIYTGGLENHPRLVERLARLRPLLGNAGRGLQEARQPTRLAELVRQAGLRFPRTQRSIPTGDLAARWLVKRQHSSGGLGVRFATAADESKFSRGSYYQEYVEGQAASATFVAAQGRAIFLGGSLQLLGRDFGQPDRPFLYSGSIAPLRLTAGETASLQTIGSVLASQLGLTGLFGVDFVRSADVLWPIEVNPRYTASVEVLERATGASFLALHAAACTGGTIPERPPDDAGTFAGKQVVYASRDLIIPPVLDRLIADWNPAGQQPGIADLPKIGERIPAGQPIATVFGESASPEDVRITLQARLAKLFQVLSTEY